MHKLTLVALYDPVSSGFSDKNSGSIPNTGGDGELGVGGILC